MGREDVARALVAMNDDEVRAALGGGDFSTVTELDLTDQEKEMVQGAAEDWPEVSGFTIASSPTAGGGGDRPPSRPSFSPFTLTNQPDAASPKLFQALNYCGVGWDLS